MNCTNVSVSYQLNVNLHDGANEVWALMTICD